MANPQLQAKVRRINERVSAIDIHGEVNGFGETILMDAYAQATADTATIVIFNFTGLDYMNSSGIGLLVTLLIRANRQGQQLLAYGLNEHYRQIFELTRLNEAIHVYSTEPEAINAAKTLVKALATDKKVISDL